MAQYLAPEQLENSSGVPLNGGKKHVYQVATTTPLALFSDEGLSTPVANPIVADASGAFAGVFLAETKCKQIVTTSADVTVFTRAVDYTIGVTNTIAADDVSYDNDASGLAAEDLQEAINEIVDLQGTTQNWESSADGPIATGTSTNTGAAAGPLVEMYRNSASPANSDVIGGMRITGKNASGTKVTYGEIHGVITDTTNASEDAKIVFQTPVSGALTDRLHVGAGGYMDGATGTDKGAGTFNAVDLYRNGFNTANTDSTSGSFSSTAVSITIPADCAGAVILIAGVSPNGDNGNLTLTLGDSGGEETTGYEGAHARLASSGVALTQENTTNVLLHADLDAAESLTGFVRLTRIASATHTWLIEAKLTRVGADESDVSWAVKATSAELTTVRIALSSNSFDAGTWALAVT